MVWFSFLHYTSLCISCDKNLREFLMLCFVVWGLCCSFLSIKIYVCTWVDLQFVNIKYLGILFKTTPNLDSAVEHLAATNSRSLFALNHRCVELRIMDVKLYYNLFNTLVCFTTSYACEVWVDFKKIEVIKVVYERFRKFLLRVRKITSTSIVLAKFGKFPYEHFAWDKCCYTIIVWT
jgi:hypothetical protein